MNRNSSRIRKKIDEEEQKECDCRGRIYQSDKPSNLQKCKFKYIYGSLNRQGKYNRKIFDIQEANALPIFHFTLFYSAPPPTLRNSF